MGRLSVARENFPRRVGAGIVPALRDPAGAKLPPPRTSDAFRYVLAPGLPLADRVGARQAPALVSRNVASAPRITSAKAVTRNAILNYPVAALADADRRRTDILHEYLSRPNGFPRIPERLAARRSRRSAGPFNVTLRYVEADTASTLTLRAGRAHRAGDAVPAAHDR